MRLLNWIELYDTEFAATGFHRQAYDVLGNRIGVASSVALEKEFHYNAERNRLVAADLPEHRDYAWDEAGYMVGRDAVDILWDAGGRIAQVGQDISLEWDVLGRPVRSNVQGQEMRALFGGAVLADSTGTPRSIDLGEVKIDLVLGERIYRHYDFRGNVKWVSGDGGEVLVHYAYGPWGVESKHGTHPDGVSFARGQALGDFLLVGARIYDPETGRFLSPDPLGHVVNLYAYTQGNPVMFWDPGGLWTRPVGSQAPAREARLTQAQRIELANVMIALGIAVASSGIIVGMPRIVFAGMVMVLAATVYKIHAMGPPGTTIVEIVDLTPGQPNYQAPTPQAGSGSEVAPASSCAPVGRRGHSGLTWWSVLLAPGQLGIAVLLARALRRRHGSG
jgi:RHS repeat-associated protein